LQIPTPRRGHDGFKRDAILWLKGQSIISQGAFESSQEVGDVPCPGTQTPIPSSERLRTCSQTAERQVPNTLPVRLETRPFWSAKLSKARPPSSIVARHEGLAKSSASNH
jgi:hypothetical protein